MSIAPVASAELRFLTPCSLAQLIWQTRRQNAYPRRWGWEAYQGEGWELNKLRRAPQFKTKSVHWQAAKRLLAPLLKTRFVYGSTEGEERLVLWVDYTFVARFWFLWALKPAWRTLNMTCKNPKH
ncbi:hypothetical protein C8J57DRAFT_1226107 [Mycena rebaudengoi]|nr:hypothetical protein C8J57DRAFT_1226107 [Mycena rebaudengoi]